MAMFIATSYIKDTTGIVQNISRKDMTQSKPKTGHNAYTFLRNLYFNIMKQICRNV